LTETKERKSALDGRKRERDKATTRRTGGEEGSGVDLDFLPGENGVVHLLRVDTEENLLGRKGGKRGER
jgi:hypothetical protein